MRRHIKKAGIIFFILFISIQFIPKKYNKSSITPPSDFMTVFDAPEDIRKIIKISCYDCHSNNTFYPWYNKVQPVAWFLEGHINEAKEALNLNTFGAYSKRRQKTKLKSVISQIMDNEMPLSSYTLMHRDAVISEEEKQLLKDWLTSKRENLDKR